MGLIAIVLDVKGITAAAVLSSESLLTNLEYGTVPAWDHSIDLNEDFRLMWTINNQDITFEIRVRALGYVGLGFSYDGNNIGPDIAIGWVEGGHTFFQVCSS